MTCFTTYTQPHRRGFGVALLVVALTCAYACDSPDTENEFNEFGKATEGQRGSSDAEVMLPDTDATKVDFSGEFFMAIKTSIGPTLPLFIQATVAVSEDLSTIDFVFQPLVNDVTATGDPAPNPRTPVGDPVTLTGVPFNDNGTFTVQLDNISVAGEANPLTGREILANLMLTGLVASSDLFCGGISGDVVEPIAAPLDPAISSFAAQKIVDSIAALEVLDECPEDVVDPDMDAGMDADMDAGMDTDMDTDMEEDTGPEGPPLRCPSGLDGDYDLYFKTPLQGEANDIILRLADSGDEMTCYTGSMLSKTDGAEIATVISALDDSDTLIVEVRDFVIPPGASASLPNGGTANIQLRALQWSPSGMCGELSFALFEPLELGGEGSFAAVDNDDANFTIDGEFCENITRGEPCGFEELAGRYTAFYITETQIDQNADPTELRMVLEANPVTCLDGYFESVLMPGQRLNSVYFTDAAPDSPELPRIRFRNFVIPPGANPLLPDGGRADIVFTSTQEVAPNAAYCGDLLFSLFEGFPTLLENAGFFSFGLEDSNAPTGPRCP